MDLSISYTQRTKMGLRKVKIFIFPIYLHHSFDHKDNTSEMYTDEKNISCTKTSS